MYFWIENCIYNNQGIEEVAELHIHSSHTEKIKTNTDLKDIFLIQPYLEVFIRMLIK